MASVSSHMTRDPLSAAPGTGLSAAAEQMAARGVGSVLVLEAGRLVGILTERDVLRAVAQGLGPDATVDDWLTPHPETIDSDDTIEHAAALMLHGGFRHLPVLEDGELAGILSIRDVMRVVLEDRMPRGV